MIDKDINGKNKCTTLTKLTPVLGYLTTEENELSCYYFRSFSCIISIFVCSPLPTSSPPSLSLHHKALHPHHSPNYTPCYWYL